MLKHRIGQKLRDALFRFISQRGRRAKQKRYEKESSEVKKKKYHLSDIKLSPLPLAKKKLVLASPLGAAKSCNNTTKSLSLITSSQLFKFQIWEGEIIT